MSIQCLRKSSIQIGKLDRPLFIIKITKDQSGIS